MPSTRTLRIDVLDGAHSLEARFTVPDEGGEGLALIAPPHPAYGGTIENPVVQALEQAFQTRGVATLAFNFRGTGESSGKQRGDLAEALEDLLAAGRALHTRPLWFLAGYSFGACVALRAAPALSVSQLLLVSPPIELMAYDDVRNFEGTLRVIIGDQDAYTPLLPLRELLSEVSDPSLDVLEGADHFFEGMQLMRLRAALPRLIG